MKSLLPSLASLLLLAQATLSAEQPAAPAAPMAHSALSAPTAGDDYRIAPKDQLQFQVFGEPDTLVMLRVSGTGEIPVPLIGDFKIAGLTLREAEKQIAALYISRRIFVEVQVILSVQTYVPRTVSVLGQVGRPGVVPFTLETDRIGLIDAITQAGGFTRVSRTDTVKVIRRSNGQEQTILINVADYLDSKGGATQFMLQPDDIVYVPERTF